jgi:hypothetical protein
MAEGESVKEYGEPAELSSVRGEEIELSVKENM